MENRVQFLEKLAGLLKVCMEKGNVIEKEEVEEFFKEDNLSEEQMVLVFDYLLAQKVLVKRYVKAGEVFEKTEKPTVNLSEEEKEYLKAYEADLKGLKGNDLLTVMFPEVIEVAKEMHSPEVFIGDLIQEGNMGLMTAVSYGETEKESLLLAVKESMQMYLESQTEMKLQDRKMADKVNHLEEEIKKLTEEMGRKVTIDELSHFMDIEEEEIEDILRLAGEEVGEIEEEE